MSFIQQPLYILTILLLLVLFSEWLAEKKFFKHIGSVLLVIIFAAILANLNIIPSSHNAPALYDGIFHYAAPLGLFFLLRQVKLKDLKLAGLPMMMMFLIGSAATIAGVVISYKMLSPQDHHINSAYAADDIITTIWMMATLILPSLFQRLIPRKRKIAPQLAKLSDEEIKDRMLQPASN